MATQHFVVRVEVVDFDRTILDTQDLSTIRGGSLAMLNAPTAMGDALRRAFPQASVDEIYSGASQAAYHLAADVPFEQIQKTLAGFAADPQGQIAPADDDNLRKVLPHLSLVVDAAVSEGETKTQLKSALDSATAKNLWRRMQNLGGAIPVFDNGNATHHCAIDRTRPAEAGVWVPNDYTPENPHDRPQEDSQTKEIQVSASVAARRRYGREARQRFYDRELNVRRAWLPAFAQSFADIVADPPDAIPLASRNKIAVVYFDGNKFGRIRERLGGSPDVLGRFSRDLKKARARDLLKPVIDGLATAAHHHEPAHWKWTAADPREDDEKRLRFETLLWGGDELIWVVPAWLAWWLVDAVFARTRGWEFDGHRLTQSGGVVLCSVKTPIRQAVALAKDLAESCKNTLPDDITAQRNLCQIMVLENVEIPEGNIGDYNERIFGVPRNAPDAAQAFTLEGQRFAGLTDLLLRIQEEFPRSQLYRLLRQARAKGVLGATDDGDAVKEVQAELTDYLDRFHSECKAQDFRALSAYVGGRQRPLLGLALLAEYWEYVAPLAASPLQRLGAEAAE